MVLDGYEGPENLGILVADDRGYFEDFNIFPTITTPISPNRPVEYVASGFVDIGVTSLPQVAMARAKGAPIVAVGSLISQPTAALIWLRQSKIRSVADLAGKTVAIPSARFQKSSLESVLVGAGLKPDEVKIRGFRNDLVSALASGGVDAIFGGSGNVEGKELQARGLEPVVTPVQELGIPAYDELVVIARSDLVARHPRSIRDFMSAVARGTAAAVKDPKGDVELLESRLEADPDQSRKATIVETESTLPLLSESAYIDPRQASDLVDWMKEEGMIQRKLPVSDFLTDDYVAQP